MSPPLLFFVLLLASHRSYRIARFPAPCTLLGSASIGRRTGGNLTLSAVQEYRQ
jgi:hypothetical protein